jgi:hypothetical protein
MASLKALVESIPPVSEFARELGLDQVEEEKLLANLDVCKRHLVAHLEALRRVKPKKVYQGFHGFTFQINVLHERVVIPRSKFTDMNPVTTAAFLSHLRSPPLAYPYVAFHLSTPVTLVIHEVYKYPEWKYGNDPEDSLVIMFRAQNPE